MISSIYLLLFIHFLFPTTDIHLNNHTLTFPSPTKYDLDQGFIESHVILSSNNIFINIDSQDPWILYIQSTSLLSGKFNNMIEWKIKGESNKNYQFLSQQKTYVKDGFGSEKIELVFRLSIDWFTHPGNYSFDIMLSTNTKESISPHIKSKKIIKK